MEKMNLIFVQKFLIKIRFPPSWWFFKEQINDTLITPLRGITSSKWKLEHGLITIPVDPNELHSPFRDGETRANPGEIPG